MYQTNINTTTEKDFETDETEWNMKSKFETNWGCIWNKH